MRRTSLIAALLVGGLALASGCATAPDSAGDTAKSTAVPRGALTIVVPFPPGGIDVIARMMQPGLAKALAQEVNIVNRPGGTGAVGSGEVARAAPDGRTLLLAPQGPLVYQPQIAVVDYDVLRSFVPVCRVTSTPSVLMVAGTTNFNRVDDVIASARAAPGQIGYSSAGAGGLPHVGMAAFAKLAGIDLRHVPTAGAAASVAALKEGTAELLAEQLPIAMANAGAGQPRIIGVFAAERVAVLPNLPTVREQGLDLAFQSWNVLLAPAATPAEEVQRLQQACRTTLAEVAPELKSKMGMDPAYLGSADTTAFMSQELPHARSLVELSGLARTK
jgi:tripartite-type tricarboxylate transporter receptor subunit TctC